MTIFLTGDENINRRIINADENYYWRNIFFLKNVPVDLKIWSNVVSKEVVKITKFNTLNTKENELEKNSSGIYFYPDKSK